MSRSLLIARRELLGYLRSPLGAVIVAGALLIDGTYFYWKGLTEKLLSAVVLQEFFYGASGPTMIAGVLLTMRLVAEERQTGTMTLLNTAPIHDREIIAGKFLAAFAVLAVMTLLTLYMPLLIFVNGKVSVGHIVVGYVGLFSSTLSRSQVVAGIVAAVIMAMLVLLWVVAKAVDPPVNEFLNALALHHENFRTFMVGTFQLDRVVYYLAVTWFFLLAATKMLEARRWR